MKFLVLTLMICSSSLWAEDYTITTTTQSEDKLLLLDKKVDKDRIVEEHKVAINFRLGYTRLTKEENENENLLNIDIETRYAFDPKWAVYVGIGQWFNLDGTNISAGGGLLAHHKNIGLSYALSGTFIRKDYRLINHLTHVYKKGNKIIVKHDRSEKTGHNKMDGWRIFANASQLELNIVEDSAYGFGAGILHEHMLESGNVFQVGLKYEQFNNKYVNANLGQLFISYGFLP